MESIDHHPDMTHEIYDKTLFGFWTYLMTDCILFATLFATYAVLHTNLNGGPSGKELFDLPFALGETMILLVSSFTSGLAVMAVHKLQKFATLAWLSVTFLLGCAFLAMELYEFNHLVQEGNSWQRSAFLSSYFTLVGTHGAHIASGLLWIIVMLFQIGIRGINSANLRRVACLGLFWHFLDVVWIFIFTIVYLMGAL